MNFFLFNKYLRTTLLLITDCKLLTISFELVMKYLIILCMWNIAEILKQYSDITVNACMFKRVLTEKIVLIKHTRFHSKDWEHRSTYLYVMIVCSNKSIAILMFWCYVTCRSQGCEPSLSKNKKLYSSKLVRSLCLDRPLPLLQVWVMDWAKTVHL